MPDKLRVQAGYLITLDGIGGSRKSTIARILREYLSAVGWDVRSSREPGATRLGRALRELLLSDEVNPGPWAEAFLFEADRAQTYAELLRSALADGAVIVSDRGPFRTVAYQGFGLGLPLGLIDEMTAAAWNGREPDLAFAIDVEPQLGRSRKAESNEQDRFDEESLAFTARVREGYLFAASLFGEKAVVIDGSLPLAEAFDRVQAVAVERLEAHRHHEQP